jgi:hypothetical protein
MGWLSKLARKAKKSLKKLTFKKHGMALLGIAGASLIPGVGGLLGKALGTGGSGFMGGLFTKGGFKNMLMHQGKKAIKGAINKKLGGAAGGLLGQAMPGMMGGMPSMMPGMVPPMMGGIGGMNAAPMQAPMPQGNMMQQQNFNPLMAVAQQDPTVPLQMGELAGDNSLFG